jgi:DTW domain-containing protein
VRETCLRCLRPTAFCVCATLAPVATRTRVVILQHPREARLAICSAWLTRLALENAELHRGVAFARDPRVSELCADPGAALLWPGEGAVLAADRAADPPRLLVTIDATWPQAVKMLKANPAIAALPRIAIAPELPGAYGDLRREPAAHCLSTLEAVAMALSALEGGPERFDPMRAAFARMVELQLAAVRNGRSPRHRPARGPRGERPVQS